RGRRCEGGAELLSPGARLEQVKWHARRERKGAKSARAIEPIIRLSNGTRDVCAFGCGARKCSEETWDERGAGEKSKVDSDCFTRYVFSRRMQIEELVAEKLAAHAGDYFLFAQYIDPARVQPSFEAYRDAIVAEM